MPNDGVMPNNDFLSTAQAADALNMHRSTLTRLVQDGKIKPVIEGEGIRGAMYFRASEVRRFKKARDEERAA